MAGSYEHLLGGCSLIEHMGDAHEAVEQLLWLVQREIGQEKAKQLLNDVYYPMVRGEAEHDEHLAEVMRLMEQ